MNTTASRPSILILTYSLISREPRALKQINYFSGRYEVTTAGFGPAPNPKLQHIRLTQENPHSGSLFGRMRHLMLMSLRFYRLRDRFDARDRSALQMLSGEEWDVVIAHDVKTITVANKLKAKSGVLIDLHEYAPRQGDEVLAWRLLIAPYFRWLCRKEVTKATAVTTVSQGIVEEYKRVFGLDAALVVNATPYQEIAPLPVSSPIRLVHSGSPAPARRLEVMVEAVRDSTANVTLDLFLIEGESDYLDRLKALAGGSNRVRFRDAVPYSELVSTLNNFDVGISILPPVNFNHLWALPNKFFDYVQARLGVIIGPSPEMKRIVDEYGIGGVTDDFTAESLVRLLDRLTPEQVASWKDSAHRSARELSSEKQVEVWGEIVARMIATR